MDDSNVVGLLTVLLADIEDLKKDVAFIKESTIRRDKLLADSGVTSPNINTIMDDAKSLLEKARNKLLSIEGEKNFGKIET